MKCLLTDFMTRFALPESKPAHCASANRKARDSSVLVCRLTFFLQIICGLMFCRTALALDFDRLYPQTLDEQFFHELQRETGQERALFLDISGREAVFYIRHDDKGWLLRGSLEPFESSLVERFFARGEELIYAPVKSDGSPLYQRGRASRVNFRLSNGRQVSIIHVPHFVNDEANDCFVCDAGYVEARLGSIIPAEAELKELLAAISQGAISIRSQVALNRYYMHRDNYLGPVERFAGEKHDNLLAGPIHKVTLYKNLRDNELKKKNDRMLVFDLLIEQRFLFSQDLRLKMGLVPASVVLKPENIENSDIGSGQNHMVFLSLGPGINYFDDPWMAERLNVPCPRMIFHRDTCRYEKLQVFPTYSIAPEASGIGRLLAINRFQNSGGKLLNGLVTAVWADYSRKQSFFENVEQALCRYGLINDSADLEPGLHFEEEFFRGNIVNNEIRLFEALAVRDLLTALIIPPDTKKQYLHHYRKTLTDAIPHWDFNCGIHFEDLFIEAPVASDKGFRAAWIKMLLRETHPVLFRLLKEAKIQGREKAFLKIASYVSDSAARFGREFFLTDSLRRFRELDKQRNELWLDYLEAFRERRPEAGAILDSYREFYARMKKICD